MEVNRTVALSASSLYNELVTLAKEDYVAATGEKIATDQLKNGLSYHKSFGKKEEHSVQITIVDLVPNQLYKVAVSSNRGVQWISYTLDEVGEMQTTVSYMEEYLPSSKFNAWNYKLLLPLMKKSLQQRMLLQLDKLVEFTKQKEVHEDER